MVYTFSGNHSRQVVTKASKDTDDLKAPRVGFKKKIYKTKGG